MSRRCLECGSHYGNIFTEYPHEYFSCLHCGDVNSKYTGVAENSYDVASIAEQVSTLEELASFNGSIPRKYEERLQHISRQIKYLESLLLKSKKGDEGRGNSTLNRLTNIYNTL